MNLRPSSRAPSRIHLPDARRAGVRATPLASIDHLAVREWIASLSASGLAPATVRKCAQVTGKIIRGAVDAGLLVTSPCERQPLPRVERDEQRFLTPAEVERLADAITPPYRPLVFVGAYGGLRAAEMYGLRRHRVDLLRTNVDVTEIVVEVQAATLRAAQDAGRSAPRAAPRFVADELADHVRRRRTRRARVPSAQGWGDTRLAVASSGVVSTVEDAGLAPVRLHDLRHTAVAMWIAAGASPNEVAARAAHTSVTTVLNGRETTSRGTHRDGSGRTSEAACRGRGTPPIPGRGLSGRAFQHRSSEGTSSLSGVLRESP